MLLDWDKLSETELKRLVSQLEKTRNDLRYIRTSIFRDFFHFRRLCKNIILMCKNTYIIPLVTILFVYSLHTIVNYLVKLRIK